MNEKAWGWSLSLDLKNCNPVKIRDENYIRKFIKELCDYIKMTPYGDTVIVRFGKDPSVYGYSVMQLIEESNIAFHFIENINCVCGDIFSCKKFNADDTINFCKEYFEAKEVATQFLERMLFKI